MLSDNFALDHVQSLSPRFPVIDSHDQGKEGRNDRDDARGRPQLRANGGADYLCAVRLRDEAAIGYDCEVDVEVQCYTPALFERGIDHIRLNPAGTA